MMKKITVLIILILSTIASQARVVLPGLIADNMVLQQESEVALWGKAGSNAEVFVTTSWDGATIKAKADKSGNWKVYVNTPSAGGPYNIVFDDGEQTTVSNVLIGEVWLCSGQSNMVMPMRGFKSQPVEGAMDYIVSAKPSCPIRICNIKRAAKFTEQSTCRAEWLEHTSEAVSASSATAYFFAKRLQETLDVPVGVIVTAWGGSKVQTWMSREVLEKFSSEIDLSFLDRQEKQESPQHAPTMLYNGMLAPLKNYAIKGVIWYQGESNKGEHELFERLNPEFIAMLRRMWCNNELPFYYVQIASFKYGGSDKFEGALIREAQAKIQKDIPYTGMAVAMDCGNEGCIHPAKKKPVADRLAYLALEKTYGKGGFDASAPLYVSHEIKGNKVLVTFSAETWGVGPKGENLEGFEVAGEDRKFYPAAAKVGRTCNVIEVVSDSVAAPVAVRYGFRNYCNVSVYNTFGIPASPFRTDDWAE